ncbi:MAG TPA: homocysteine S-methyltransferase family protein [Solirubrobacteraceae bacterium]|nr:homocysteine S-methyltransferase family protein [Solirubrobacteraceae bacterium]
MTTPQPSPGLLERLASGPVICAEGYLFECERRGYLQAGAYVPTVVLDHPEVVTSLHREFAHAGSDVIEAFTYYGHREKLRMVGKEDLLEPLNRRALELARDVARATGTLLAGNISNTNIYAGDAETAAQVRAMYEEQIGWAVEGGADFLIAETISWLGEAEIALEVMRATGLPTVVTLAVHATGVMRDGPTPEEACARLAAAGADVVGLNCSRGPATMLPVLERVRAAVDGHVAALPVPYRTDAEHPTFQSLREPGGEERVFPTALDPFTCTRYEIAEFGARAAALGVGYLGVCCGAGPHHIRSLAEAVGRTPEASRYSPDMSKHAYFGTASGVRDLNKDYAESL